MTEACTFYSYLVRHIILSHIIIPTTVTLMRSGLLNIPFESYIKIPYHILCTPQNDMKPQDRCVTTRQELIFLMVLISKLFPQEVRNSSFLECKRHLLSNAISVPFYYLRSSMLEHSENPSTAAKDCMIFLISRLYSVDRPFLLSLFATSFAQCSLYFICSRFRLLSNE